MNKEYGSLYTPDIEFLIKTIQELAFVATGKVKLYTDRFGWTDETRQIDRDIANIILECDKILDRLDRGRHQ